MSTSKWKVPGSVPGKTSQKSRTPTYISRNKPKVSRPAYHHDDKQTDKRVAAVKLPKRGIIPHLGAGKQANVIPANHKATHPDLLQKVPDKSRVLPAASQIVKNGKLLKK